MSVLGIDPGHSGALATYDTISKKILDIVDMPTWQMTINSKKRTRIDAVALYEYMEFQKMAGCELVMLEAIGGRPAQQASSAFVLGYGVGLIYAFCLVLRLPIETVPPTVWKKFMRVPGKKDLEGKKGKTADAIIINRADEILPDARHFFRGLKKNNKGEDVFKVDRAEAAMLAKYAGDYQLRVPNRPFLAVETVLAYQHAETGA